MVDEIRIHSGTQVRLRGLRDDELPASFLQNLQELARRERQVEAVYLFGMQPEDEEERVALVLALRGGLFSNKSEEFLRLVDTIGQLLPSDLSINVYRFGASQLIAGYCLQTLDPVFLRSPDWVEKQRRRFDD
ncbi:MAG: enhanced serine sensitivity protein SseB [Acidobacteria bacterium]|nr:enhanced serine sensitivity protein SseB [Acidobacteriota bacterium]